MTHNKNLNVHVPTPGGLLRKPPLKHGGVVCAQSVAPHVDRVRRPALNEVQHVGTYSRKRSARVLRAYTYVRR